MAISSERKAGRIETGSSDQISIKSFESLVIDDAVRAANATVATADVDEAYILVAEGKCAYTPAISSLSPSSVASGGATFTLTVNGNTANKFQPTAVVYAGATALTTTFVSDTQVTASVPASVISSSGTISVTVRNFGATSKHSTEYAVSAGSNLTVT